MKAIICLVFGGLALGVLFQGGFLHIAVIGMIADGCLVPCALVLSGFAIAGLVRCRPASPMYRRVNTLLYVSILSLILSFATGSALFRLRLSITHHHVADLVPALEAGRRESGMYPKTVPVLTDRLYSMLGFPLHYSSAGSAFRFQHDDPAGIMDNYEFSSENRTWRKVGH